MESYCTRPKYVYLVLAVAGLLAVAMEIPMSWTSPMFGKLKSNDSHINPLDRPITPEEDAWIASLVTVGALIGPFPAGYVAETIGRKMSLLMIAIPLGASFFALAFTTNMSVIYAARALSGGCMGAGYAIIPVYFTEVAQDHNRGMITQALNIFWCIGNCFSYVVGPFVSYKVFNVMAGCYPIIFAVMFIFLGPESPYFLATKGKLVEATNSLMVLRYALEDEVEEELSHIIKQVERKAVNNRFLDLFTDTVARKALFISTVITLAQELTGFCAILFYLQPIFDAAKTDVAPEVSAIAVSVVICISSFITPFVIDRAGRRILLMISCFGLWASLMLLGAYFYIADRTTLSNDPIFWLPLLSLVFYILSYNIGLSSVPFMIASELLPRKLRQLGSIFQSTIAWCSSFVISKFFNDMNNNLGRDGTFWIFAVFSLITGIFTAICLPETKEKSFNEIQDILGTENIFRHGIFRKK